MEHVGPTPAPEHSELNEKSDLITPEQARQWLHHLHYGEEDWALFTSGNGHGSHELRCFVMIAQLPEGSPPQSLTDMYNAERRKDNFEDLTDAELTRLGHITAAIKAQAEEALYGNTVARGG